jgi:hypothetical protein
LVFNEMHFQVRISLSSSHIESENQLDNGLIQKPSSS